jgi:hypothetical protein
MQWDPVVAQEHEGATGEVLVFGVIVKKYSL